jgi:hypothetical protein
MANEVSAVWKQNAAQVIPIVISSTGVTPKSLSQSLKRLNLHPNTVNVSQLMLISEKLYDDDDDDDDDNNNNNNNNRKNSLKKVTLL